MGQETMQNPMCLVQVVKKCVHHGKHVVCISQASTVVVLLNPGDAATIICIAARVEPSATWLVHSALNLEFSSEPNEVKVRLKEQYISLTK